MTSETVPTGTEPTAARPAPVAPFLLAIALVFASQFAWVEPTNFSGYDEWLYVSLASRGIVSFPEQNRPFVLMWHVPPAVLFPHHLDAFYFFHATYLVCAGFAVFALCRRLLGDQDEIALLAGIFACAFAPGDHARLNAVVLAGYAGHTAAALLAMLGYVEAQRRASWPLLGAACALAFVVARGAEAAIPLMAAAPLAAIASTALPRRLGAAAALLWEGVLLIAVLLLVRPLFVVAAGSVGYQSSLGLDLHPVRIGLRMLRQFAYHLGPLVSIRGDELMAPATVLSVAALGVAVVIGTASLPGAQATSWRRCAALAAAGLVLAGAGYSLFTLAARIDNPMRTELLSGPGIGLFLAAACCAGASLVPPRWRRTVIVLLAAWPVAVATARTLAMQRDWDVWGSFPAQSGLLRAMTQIAPGLRPNTAVILIDEDRHFPASFAFRHAVRLLYGPEVVGHVWDRSEYLYDFTFAPHEVRSEPWPHLRGPWEEAVTRHRYDEVVVLHAARGQLAVASSWPSPPLPSLAEGARYRPRERILAVGTPLPERRILDRGRNRTR